MARSLAVMGYGTEADRLRLAVLAKALKCSGSEIIINNLRSAYKELYGEKDPAEVAKNLGVELK